MLSKIVNVRVRDCQFPRTLKELWNDPFAAAGDDILDEASTDEGRMRLSLYPPIIQEVGLTPSQDKTDMYTRGGIYCEGVVLVRDQDKYPTDPSKFNLETALVETLKVRLLTPETKPQKGDEEINPIFGKCYQLAARLRWLPPNQAWLRDRCLWLFTRNHRDYIRSSGRIVYNLLLPTQLGGLGFTPSSLEESKVVYDLMPLWHKRALGFIAMNPQNERPSRVLSNWSSSRLFERGMDFQDIKDNPIYELLDDFGLLESFESLYARLSINLDPEISRSTRYKEKHELILRSGYVDITRSLRSWNNSTIWDPLSVISRGWPMRSFESRNAILERYLKEIIPESYEFKENLEDLTKLLNIPLRYVSRSYIHRDIPIMDMDTGNPVPLNLIGEAAGASLCFKYKNRQILGNMPEQFDQLWFRKLSN